MNKKNFASKFLTLMLLVLMVRPSGLMGEKS